jgi:predicted aspartyl protease
VILLSVSFPYAREKVGNNFIMRPKIPVTLSWDGKVITVVALLDSGSDFSSIPVSLAEALGLVISNKEREIVGIGGKIKTKTSQVNMSVEDIHLGRMPIEVTESPELDFPIIGRIPFFQIFDITFRENSNRIILNKILRR